VVAVPTVEKEKTCQAASTKLASNSKDPMERNAILFSIPKPN
jgi:hypothetical protein